MLRRTGSGLHLHPTKVSRFLSCSSNASSNRESCVFLSVRKMATASDGGPAPRGVVVSSDARRAESSLPSFLCRFLHCVDVLSGMLGVPILTPVASVADKEVSVPLRVLVAPVAGIISDVSELCQANPQFHLSVGGRSRTSVARALARQPPDTPQPPPLEEADHSTPRMPNFARRPRVIPLAELTFCSGRGNHSRPHSTHNTIAYAELAETTASSIPSPTCAFDGTSGDSGATHICITSPNYSENYAPDGSCVIKLASLLTLDETDFRTEVLWDTQLIDWSCGC